MLNSMDSGAVAIFVPGFKLFGQERALINLGLTLRDAGYRVVFLIHGVWGFDHVATALTALGFKWAALPLGTIWSPRLLAGNPKSIFGNIASLSRTKSRLTYVLDELRITHLITSNITFTSYLVGALRGRDVTMIFRHGDAPMRGTPLERFLSRTVFARTDVHVANCRFLAEKVRAFDSRITARVIYNFPVSRIEGKSLLAPSGALMEPRMVFVGQLAPHKGVDLLLAVFEGLAARYPTLGLDIVGSQPGVGNSDPTPTTRKLQKLTAAWPDRVKHYGQLDDPSAVFAQGAIHICPSVWDDPSPNTIFEAKLHGLPTVAFPRGGIPELIKHQEDGYLCSPESADGLAQGIRFFLDSPGRLASAQRAAAQSLHNDFGLERNRSEWLAVMSQVTTDKKLGHRPQLCD
jgi:glycosyltransferase involved in cell wall biosynthesis